jgi:two-component system NtrC family sensor kinase
MSKALTNRLLAQLLVASTVVMAAAALLNFEQRRGVRLPDDGVTWIDGSSGVEALRIRPESGAARAGIKHGDVLRRIDTVRVDDAAAVSRILTGIGVWEKATYVVARSGVEVSKPLIVGAVPLNTFIHYFLGAVALSYLAIGVFVFYRKSAEPMVRHFYVFCLGSFVLYAFSYTSKLDGFDRFVYWSDVWATLLVPAVFLHFCLVFPDSRHATRARRGAAALAYVPVAALLALHHGAASGVLETNLPLVELRFLLDRLEYGLLGLYFLSAAAVVGFAVRGTEEPILRQQRKWLAQGTLWGVLPFVIFYVGPYVGGEIVGPNGSLAVFSLALIPAAFAYAIFKYRLMDVEVVVRRGTAYTLATAALLALFYGLIFLLSGMVAPQLNELAPAGWVISVVAAAIVFQPLRRRIQQGLERRFYRERYDYRQTLVEFASELSTETNLEPMLSSASQRLVRTLGLRRMAIFVASGDSNGEPNGFRLMHGAGLTGVNGTEINEQSWLDMSFLGSEPVGKNGSVPYLFLEDPATSIECSPAAKLTIADLDLSYYVACRVRGRTIAYLGLGRTLDGNYLSSEDLALVQTVSGYFAIAVENARLYYSLELKANEYQRLKDYNENIVESLSVGILAADLEDRVESWNAQLELTFGISRDQAVGRRLAHLLPAGLVAEIERVRGESGIQNVYKFRLRADDFPTEFRPQPASNGGSRGEERMLNIAIAPLVAKNFDPIGRLIILDDVTERVELEEQLAHADKMSSIGVLAAGVAHEVNTPLAVISSYAQMLAKQVAGDPQQMKILDKITSQTFRASEIVNALLNASRVSPRELAPLDLNQVLKETLSLVEPQLPKDRIKIHLDLQPEAASVVGNSGKLQQVFLNLLLNARDAMPRGGELTVRTRVVESDEGEPAAQVVISDTGVGMTAEQARRAFEPFFTTKEPKRGTGLGLAVSYGIVREHSGTMSVESAPGKGASFRVELPLAGKPVHA